MTNFTVFAKLVLDKQTKQVYTSSVAENKRNLKDQVKENEMNPYTLVTVTRTLNDKTDYVWTVISGGRVPAGREGQLFCEPSFTLKTGKPVPSRTQSQKCSWFKESELEPFSFITTEEANW